ncbi:uncharacterized protein LAESUDRAFT_639796 [Laetiporus sulphureus 93-53]|uniref:F-box domain-containing protein n=1 Tax=Laetiporus sulphureus 93-53 TaxID=1314785 RepID=A0A165IJH2_9APHY|nr:uncharacterized protein LAESUDRAFT_639796 [Laetiporus sulphureus 93-53]KZT13165.1 hypothetical protein LAESUDRAFT_639796 [Laetiporus sulphureus 93-53]
MSDSDDRLRYRRQPTPEDVLAARAEIREHENAISGIQEHITGLLLQVQRLRREQEKHQAAINKCKGVITLARRIPEELLAKIFEQCVADGWSRSPITVSHVCSAWRKAACTPRVWSHVYVNCPSPDALDRTRFWLGMARQAPLDITVVTGWCPDWQLGEVMEILLQHMRQWRTFVIESPDSTQVDHILSCIARIRVPRGACLPNLREVYIATEVHFEDPTDSEDNPPDTFEDAFGPHNAPKLSALLYTSNVLPLCIPDKPTFPSHLTRLDLTFTESLFQRPLAAESLLTLFEGVPELRSLALAMPLMYVQPFVPEVDASRTVCLAHLEELSMYGPTDMNGFLPHMRAPSLRRLHLRSLEDVGYRQQPLGPSLLRFLYGKEGTITEHEDGPLSIELLELHDIDLTPEAFVECFEALSNLRELRLHESSLSDAMLALLQDPQGLCPRLTRLDLRWCGHLSGRALVELVRSRLRPDGAQKADDASAADPISEVAIINCCFVEEPDVMDMAAMTVCRVVMREGDDYCRMRGCCDNSRYRTRLRLKHADNIIRHAERSQGDERWMVPIRLVV